MDRPDVERSCDTCKHKGFTCFEDWDGIRDTLRCGSGLPLWNAPGYDRALAEAKERLSKPTDAARIASLEQGLLEASAALADLTFYREQYHALEQQVEQLQGEKAGLEGALKHCADHAGGKSPCVDCPAAHGIGTPVGGCHVQDDFDEWTAALRDQKAGGG